MPKTVKTPLPEDVPFWDALVTELGDPRPYVPIEIGHVVATNEPCVDVDDCADAHETIRRHVRDAHACFDGLTHSATEKFNRIWEWPPGVLVWSNSVQDTQQLPALMLLSTPVTDPPDQETSS